MELVSTIQKRIRFLKNILKPLTQKQASPRWRSFTEMQTQQNPGNEMLTGYRVFQLWLSKKYCPQIKGFRDALQTASVWYLAGSSNCVPERDGGGRYSDAGMFIGEELSSSGEEGAKTILQGNTPLRNFVAGFVSWISHKYLRRLPTSESQEEKHALKERARKARTWNNHFTGCPPLQIPLPETPVKKERSKWMNERCCLAREGRNFALINKLVTEIGHTSEKKGLG